MFQAQSKHKPSRATPGVPRGGRGAGAGDTEPPQALGKAPPQAAERELRPGLAPEPKGVGRPSRSASAAGARPETPPDAEPPGPPAADDGRGPLGRYSRVPPPGRSPARPAASLPPAHLSPPLAAQRQQARGAGSRKRLPSCPQRQLPPASCLHPCVPRQLLGGQVLERGVGSGRGLRRSCRTLWMAFERSVTEARGGGRALELQGCKIKALRAKTNTYIKTPVRGEEPVFIVTGRKEDVEMAKREILSAAEHFSVIRATRSKAGGLPGAAQGPPHLPGQTTIQVRVPYRVVGLVVGPKGATIKRIQQRTHTYIVTPGRDKEPVFAVTGMPENVDRAREEIEAHITLRTGAFTDAGPDSDFHANGTDVCLDLLGTAAGLWAKAPNPGRRPPAPTAGLRGDTALGAPEVFYAGARGGPCPPPDSGPSEGARKPPAAPRPAAPALARECVVCAEGEVMAALVPCGHNLFCMDCAVRICGKSEPECPACRTPATQAIRVETAAPRHLGS
ncbi:RNA-binding protein MEX3D [Suricata suricatta]|uniref:RNA-binding protein MEX3D n=1 Tax=Suricata suricatta TaxID=37032 RepID=UPI001155873B|nr:RNA-binding protein MEX3D [Suricata suricatta]